MKTYHVTVMSIDPMENPEDNHQKYWTEVQAENAADAQRKAREEFEERGLPVAWTKVN